MNNIPWVEKYRPQDFDNIVLDENNRKILDNIIKNNDIPDLLFYGPPGTGKTTTIINLIKAYKERNNIKNSDVVIHLNASDDRGIEVIRNNIMQFVNSSGLFNESIKFVILDEVDYMTKNAQQALKYLLSTKNNNVRFILICNYISKIETSVQDRLLKLQFNQLPKDNIFEFLKIVCKKEKLSIKDDVIANVINTFKSDVRSMINYLQCNKTLITKKHKYLDSVCICLLIEQIKTRPFDTFQETLYNMSQTHNIERIEIIKQLIKHSLMLDNIDTLQLSKKLSYITHNNINNIDIISKYVYYNLRGSLCNACST